MIPQTKTFQVTELLKSPSEFSIRRAKQISKEWVEHEPSNPQAFFSLGLVYFMQQKVLKSRDAYLQAVQLDPSLAAAWHNLAMTYIILEDMDHAFQAATTSLETSQGIIERLRALDILSLIHARQGEPEKAVERLSEFPASGFRCDSLLRLLWFMGDIKNYLVELVRQSTLVELPISLMVVVKGDEQIEESFQQFQEKIKALLCDGFSLEEIMNALDFPPENITPATPEYAEWWNKELNAPDWEASIKSTLTLLANDSFTELLLSEKCTEDTVSWSDFQVELGL